MRVLLRAVGPDDRSRLLSWRNSPAVAAHMLTDHPISVEEHDHWFATLPRRRDRRYWVIERDGAPVGLTNLAGIDPAAQRCEWAYYLADPATRGQGVGSCVEFMVLRLIFEDMGFNKVWCEVLAGNAPSLRLLEGIGFLREACFREHVIKDGQFTDVIGLGLLQGEWPAAKAALEARLRARGLDPALLSPPP